MEALTAATGALTPPILSLNKFRTPSFRRILRFSTSLKCQPPFHDDSNSNNELNHESGSPDSALVPIFSKDAAMGLVLSAANVRGWTTGSGMEGPPVPAGSDPDSCLDPVSTFPWSLFTKSPRRRMRVAFTCKVCGQRTTRAINPHAYTDGTVFVQCCGCNIFHKLVDNLNLFNEMKCYVSSNFNPNHQNDDLNIKFLDEDNSDDTFPLM